MIGKTYLVPYFRFYQTMMIPLVLLNPSPVGAGQNVASGSR